MHIRFCMKSAAKVSSVHYNKCLNRHQGTGAKVQFETEYDSLTLIKKSATRNNNIWEFERAELGVKNKSTFCVI